MARKTSRQIGDFGESLAEKYLKKRGWHILSRNFSARGGEIDIIGFRLGSLVYFEVKTRSGDAYGLPADAVDAGKIGNIQAAAKQFLRLYGEFGKIPVAYPLGIEGKRKIKRQRIDVIEVYLTEKSQKINHIKNWGTTL